MEFYLEKAEEKDVPEIMSIMEEAVRTAKKPEWFVPDDKEYVREHLSHKGFVVAAKTSEGELAGFFLVKYPEPEESLGTYLGYTREQLLKTAVMDSAAVKEKFRGQGLQRAMCARAEELLDRERYACLMCTVHPDNLASLKSMEKNGYHQAARVSCYGGLPRLILVKER